MLLVLACAALGCTVTGEGFEPTRVVPSETETGGLIGSDAPPPPAQAPAGPFLTPDTGEGLDPIGVLEPVDIGDDGAIGTNSAAEPDAGRNTGVEPGDAGEASTFDAGAPDAAVSTPTTSLPDASTPPASTPPATQPPLAEPQPPEPCPGIVFEEACYQFLAERVSWDVADARCVAWGGHLASVETSDEDFFIGVWPALLGVTVGDGSGIWLGGTDGLQDGDFRWSDERPLSFLGWAPNQPDNGQGFDCIQKRNDGTGRWYDLRCSDAQPYVCERPQ